MFKAKTLASFVLAAALVVVGTASQASTVHAAEVPTLNLYASVGSSIVQATVINADPNVSVILHYPSGGSVLSANIGTSNSVGYLNTTVNSATYGIAAGSQVFVSADGANSQAVPWPNYTSSGSLSLSQSSVSLAVGNNAIITASVSASLSVSTNSNPSVASASASGNQVNITALAAGTTNVSVCAASIGCSVVAVTVSSSGSSVPASLYVSQNGVTVTAGQSQSITITGSGNYFISNNTNTAASSASISGSSLNITGLSQGFSTINLCATGSDGSSTCMPISATVNPASASNSSASQAVPSFAQSQVTLSIGQTQSVAILGTAPFTLGSNSTPSAVSASINGSNVVFQGIATGGANVSICQFSSGGCTNIYVYVQPDGGVSPAQSSQAPALSSFSVSSSNANGLSSAGNSMTLSFTLNQSVSTPIVSVAGSRVSVNGTGSGPYTGTYQMTGDEAQPMQVSMTFTNTSGLGGQASFSVSAPSSASASPGGSSASGNFTFLNNLSTGSTGLDVSALQLILIEQGFLKATANGTYGPATTAAVKAFQAAHGISQLGNVGPSTRAALNSILSGNSTGTVSASASSGGYVFSGALGVGSSGTEVTELQKRLSAEGFFTATANGNYGPATEAAVKAYQKAHGISQLGNVGPATLAALNGN